MTKSVSDPYTRGEEHNFPRGDFFGLYAHWKNTESQYFKAHSVLGQPYSVTSRKQQHEFSGG